MQAEATAREVARWSLERRLRTQLLLGLMAAWAAGAVAVLLGLQHEVDEILASPLTDSARAYKEAVLWETARWLALPLLTLLPLSAWVVQRVLRHAFHALEPARRALVQSAEGLHELPLADVPLELQPLMQSMNMLMERLRAANLIERSYSAYAAHELRKPLAAARAQAQRIEQMARDDLALADRARAMVRQLDHLTALASRLLQLARVESGAALRREPVDLQLLAQLVIDEFSEARRGGRLYLRVDAGASVVAGDIDMLGIALRNLIDNAFKHAGAQAVVMVQAGAARVEVTDDGPGVAAADLERLVRPFERGAGAGEGTGLGLAMADIIARQSGGTLVLRSPIQEGRGFAASLHFPMTSHALQEGA